MIEMPKCRASENLMAMSRPANGFMDITYLTQAECIKYMTLLLRRGYQLTLKLMNIYDMREYCCDGISKENKNEN